MLHLWQIQSHEKLSVYEEKEAGKGHYDCVKMWFLCCAKVDSYVTNRYFSLLTILEWPWTCQSLVAAEPVICSDQPFSLWIFNVENQIFISNFFQGDCPIAHLLSVLIAENLAPLQALKMSWPEKAGYKRRAVVPNFCPGLSVSLESMRSTVYFASWQAHSAGNEGGRTWEICDQKMKFSVRHFKYCCK